MHDKHPEGMVGAMRSSFQGVLAFAIEKTAPVELKEIDFWTFDNAPVVRKQTQKKKESYYHETFNHNLSAISLTYAITSISSFAQVITFDESVHATLNGAALPFVVGPDPSGGIADNA